MSSTLRARVRRSVPDPGIARAAYPLRHHRALRHRHGPLCCRCRWCAIRTASPYRWNEHPARIRASPRDGDADGIRWISLDRASSSTPRRTHDLRTGAWRSTLSPMIACSRATASPLSSRAGLELLDDRPRPERSRHCTIDPSQEFPTIDVPSRRAAVSLCLCALGLPEELSETLVGESPLLTTIWSAEPACPRLRTGTRCGEFIFVPRARGTADDGWLVAGSSSTPMAALR
jgi:hypothetical protein